MGRECAQYHHEAGQKSHIPARFFALGKIPYGQCSKNYNQQHDRSSAAQHASDIVEELAFQSIPGRLARLLIDRYGGEDGPVARDLTLDDMAAHIGTTREMVCRALYRFADDGMIEITRTEFSFKDRDLLVQLAHKNID